MADLERYARVYHREYGDPGYKRDKRSVLVEEPLYARVWKIIHYHPRFESSRSLRWKDHVFTFAHAVREALAVWVDDHEQSSDWDGPEIDPTTFDAAYQNRMEWRKYLKTIDPDQVPDDYREHTLSKLVTISLYATDLADRREAQRLIDRITKGTT